MSKTNYFYPTEVSEEICVHTVHPTHIDIGVFTMDFIVLASILCAKICGIKRESLIINQTISINNNVYIIANEDCQYIHDTVCH